MGEVGKERKERRGKFLQMRGTTKQINFYREEKRRQRRERRRIEEMIRKGEERTGGV